MNATELMKLLERHYEPPPSRPAGGKLITEIQAPMSLRRADALYIPSTTSGRGTIIGHELKVSRSDLITELRDPHKADTWFRHCHRWWLVISDEAFLSGLDVPEQWGVLVPGAGGRSRLMRVVRQAPALKPNPKDVALGLGTVMARILYLADGMRGQLASAEASSARSREAAQAANRELHKLQAQAGEIGYGRRGKTTISEILESIEKLGGYGSADEVESAFAGLAWRVEPEHVARAAMALALADEAEGIQDQLVAHENRMENAVRKVREAREALGRDRDAS